MSRQQSRQQLAVNLLAPHTQQMAQEPGRDTVIRQCNEDILQLRSQLVNFQGQLLALQSSGEEGPGIKQDLIKTLSEQIEGLKKAITDKQSELSARQQQAPEAIGSSAAVPMAQQVIVNPIAPRGSTHRSYEVASVTGGNRYDDCSDCCFPSRDSGHHRHDGGSGATYVPVADDDVYCCQNCGEICCCCKHVGGCVVDGCSFLGSGSSQIGSCVDGLECASKECCEAIEGALKLLCCCCEMLSSLEQS